MIKWILFNNVLLRKIHRMFLLLLRFHEKCENASKRGEVRPLADRAPGEEPGDHYPVYQPFNRPSPLPFILVAARRNRNSYFCGPSEPSKFIITRNSLLHARNRHPGLREMPIVR